jgi:hypothetical protein
MTVARSIAANSQISESPTPIFRLLNLVQQDKRSFFISVVVLAFIVLLKLIFPELLRVTIVIAEDCFVGTT